MLKLFSYAKRHISAAREYARIGPWCLLNHRHVAPNIPILGSLAEALILLTRMREGRAVIIQVGAHTGHGSHDIPDTMKLDDIHSFLIEPQPDIYQDLKINFSEFPNVTTVNAAISDKEGAMQIFRIRDNCNVYHSRGGTFGRSIGSLDKNHPLNYFRANCTNAGLSLEEGEILESVSVQSLTANQFMERYHIKEAHALIIDTEGHDYLILRQFLDAGLRPYLIRYEHVHLGQAKAQSWDILRKLGYFLAISRRTGETVAFDCKYFS